MKPVFFLSLFCLMCSGSIFAQQETKKAASVLYCLEQLDEADIMNSYTYPRPVLPHDQVRALISRKLVYPESGKKNFRHSFFIISMYIDVNGKSKQGIVFSSGLPEAEEIARDILFDSVLTWKPAKRNKTEKPLTIAVPVEFYPAYENEKVYFVANFFINDKPYILDSTDTYPALFPGDSEKKEFYVYTKNFITPSALHNDKPYGAVKLGFEIDTNGHVQEQKIFTAIDPYLDTLSLRFIERTNGKWISARKNGMKVPSYKYFNCLYNDIYFTEKNGGAYLDLRKRFEKETPTAYLQQYTLANHDRSKAMELLDDKNYKESLLYFNKALRYYIYDVDLLMKRAVAHYYNEEVAKACTDLRSLIDIADIQGYPANMSREQVEAMIVKFCE